MKEKRKSIFTVEELTEEKERLLAEFKDCGEKIDHAEGEYSKNIINQDRERLAIRIEALDKKIREIEQQNE